MGYIKSDSVPKKHNEYLFIYICLVISAGLRFFSFFQSVLPASVYLFIILLSFGLAGFAALLFIIKTSTRLSENRAFYIWLLLALYMVLIGALRTDIFSLKTANTNYFVFQDLAYIVLFITGAMFANRRGVRYYHKMMVVLGVASVICAVFAIVSYNFDITRIATRGDNMWTMAYFLWWPAQAFSTYLFSYSRVTGKYRIIAYTSFGLNMLLALLFQKRGPLLECVFIYFLLALIKPVRFKTRFARISTRILTVVLTLAVAAVALNIVGKVPYLDKVYDSVMGRFEEIDTSEDSRVEESRVYYLEAEPDEIILGQGAGCYFTTSLRFLNALHIGFSNAVYKGGIFYALFDLWIIIAAIRMLVRYRRLSPFALTCLVTTLAYLLTSLHDGGWSYTMVIFGYATPICYVLQYNEERDRKLVVE